MYSPTPMLNAPAIRPATPASTMIPGSGVRPGDAHDEGEVGDEPVVRAEHDRPEDAVRPRLVGRGGVRQRPLVDGRATHGGRVGTAVQCAPWALDLSAGAVVAGPPSTLDLAITAGLGPDRLKWLPRRLVQGPSGTAAKCRIEIAEQIPDAPSTRRCCGVAAEHVNDGRRRPAGDLDLLLGLDPGVPTEGPLLSHEPAGPGPRRAARRRARSGRPRLGSPSARRAGSSPRSRSRPRPGGSPGRRRPGRRG